MVRGRGKSSVLLFSLLILGAVLTASPAGAVTVSEFSAGMPASAQPDLITSGPDGNLWFANDYIDSIGRVSTTGSITIFSSGVSDFSQPSGITAGPDGNLWFTEKSGNRIGRITTGGVVTEFSVGITAASYPTEIAAGSDGNLWFTEFAGNRIGRITPAGVVTEFSAGITAGSQPSGITAGPDGNIWFTEAQGRIGRITPSGDVTEFSAGISAGSNPTSITAGRDGNLWFAEYVGGRIGRITPAGVATEFSAGISPMPGILGITAGPDGNVWFTESNLAQVGRITPSGEVTEYSSGITAASGPWGITTGPDGNIWFAENAQSRVARLIPDSPIVVTSPAEKVTETTVKLKGTVNPQGESSSAYFDFGPTALYGSSSSAKPVNGVSAIPVDETLTGLQPDTEYHYRVVASSSEGTVVGKDLTFRTKALPVIVPPDPVKSVVAIVTGKAKVKSNGRFAVSLSCTGETNCSGSLVLTAKSKLKQPGRKAKVKTLTIARANFSIAAGKTGPTSIKLNGPGRKLLKKTKSRKLITSASATANGKTVKRAIRLIGAKRK